jgi:ELWxxDGT repeat protein
MRHRSSAFLVSLLAAAAGAAAAEAPAAVPRLVADVRPQPRPPDSASPRALTAARDLLFFAAQDPFAGIELWATDGTRGGTHRVADVCPGPCSSHPQLFTAADHLVYFLAQDPAHGHELWRSDGTAAGTFLVADLEPGLPWGGHAVEGLVSAGSRAYLVVNRARDGTTRQELWTSDGTPRGTAPLIELTGVTLLGPAGDVLFFVGLDADHGQELWASDGTPAGTRLVRDINPGEASAVSAGPLNVTAAVLGRRLYFQAFDPAHGGELWSSDGTAAGTRLVRDLLPGSGSSSSSPGFLRAAGKSLYFVAQGPAGAGLWRSDGTAAGTRLVPGQPGPGWFVEPVFALGEAVLFAAVRPGRETLELWTSGGAGGARRLLVRPLADSLGPFARLGASAVFRLRSEGREPELWRTDGTPGGTAAVTAIGDGFELAAFGGAVWFARASAERGEELWRSNGTAAGTRLFADLHGGDRSSHPLDLLDLDGTLVFTADDGEHGRELWRSDGTRGGTALVGDLVAPDPDPAAAFGGPSIVGRASGAALFAGGGALWRSTGVPGDAMLLRDGLGVVAPARAVGGVVFFTSAVIDETEAGREWVLSLWRSDGTAAGTIALAEVARADADGQHGPAGPPRLEHLAASGGALWFLSDGLWRSDGTPAGTVRLLAEICPGSCGAGGLAAAGGTVFLAVLTSDFDTQRVRHEIWRTDGTAGGTFRLRIVLDVSFPVYGANANGFALRGFTAAGRRLFFVAADAVHGAELWASDGTAEGTRMVRDLRPGPAGSDPGWLTAGGDRVFFAADGGLRGQELWLSDGTGPGTRPVRDVAPGSASSYPQELAMIDGLLHFAAFDPEHGLEVWRSDGTAAGTWLLADVFPGPASSAPRSFTLAGGKLFFAAGRPRFGYELWAIDGYQATRARSRASSPAPLLAVALAACCLHARRASRVDPLEAIRTE